MLSMNFSNILSKLDEAAELYSVLIEQQQYNPSQAVKVLIGFNYCDVNDAWTIAKQYHARPLIKGKLRSLKPS